MKYKITRMHYGKLDGYKAILDNYNATYNINKNFNWYHYAIIELNSVNSLKRLARELDTAIIVSEYKDELIIYDDYM